MTAIRVRELVKSYGDVRAVVGRLAAVRLFRWDPAR